MGSTSLFPNQIYVERERAAADALAKLKQVGVDLYHLDKPLEKETVDEIFGQSGCYREVKAFLNFLEDYSGASRMGILHDDVPAVVEG